MEIPEIPKTFVRIPFVNYVCKTAKKRPILIIVSKNAIHVSKPNGRNTSFP